MQLELRNNHQVTVKLSFLDSAVRVTLLAAETNGIWIKADELQETLPGSGGRAIDADAPALDRPDASLAVFVPFAQVQYVLMPAESC